MNNDGHIVVTDMGCAMSVEQAASLPHSARVGTPR